MLFPLCSHACICCTESFLSGKPFLLLLIHSLLLSFPCSLLPVHYFSHAGKFGEFFQPSSPTTAVCLYMAVSYLVRQAGGGRKQPISLARSPWTLCVYVCVLACARVQERERGRQRETASSHGDTYKLSEHFHFLKLHCLKMQTYSGGSPLSGVLLTLPYFPAG